MARKEITLNRCTLRIYGRERGFIHIQGKAVTRIERPSRAKVQSQQVGSVAFITRYFIAEKCRICNSHNMHIIASALCAELTFVIFSRKLKDYTKIALINCQNLTVITYAAH